MVGCTYFVLVRYLVIRLDNTFDGLTEGSRDIANTKDVLTCSACLASGISDLNGRGWKIRDPMSWRTYDDDSVDSGWCTRGNKEYILSEQVEEINNVDSRKG